ncbi:hypothetical protein HPB48_024002 [Haemaphysalis longicornis]|uniref:Cytochrome P450 n=1 Tax=Haemaphysalis longicornis TaxID=44386 RepID=A0A9J6H8B4_HAELO|nr:hypothetical protein HPB48_024002 [Haemaphysalis longicornis]
MVNVYSLHRNKSLYPDPEKYLPERFIEKKVEEMHPFAFVAFSGGVRPCLGELHFDAVEHYIGFTIGGNLFSNSLQLRSR